MLYHFYLKLNKPFKEATTFRYVLCDLFISKKLSSIFESDLYSIICHDKN